MLLAAAEERSLFGALSENEELRDAIAKDMTDAGLSAEAESFARHPPT